MRKIFISEQQFYAMVLNKVLFISKHVHDYDHDHILHLDVSVLFFT
jgi:hypothetical protein